MRLVIKTGRQTTGTEGERRWREGFGPPKNFGVTPPVHIDVMYNTACVPVYGIWHAKLLDYWNKK